MNEAAPRRALQHVAIRPALAEDAAAIARIYNEGILDRVATLETETRSAEERRQWLAGKSARHPVFVAEAAGAVVAWGSLNVFNARSCYDHVADFSVYVARECRGRGLGALMLAHLIEAARAIGFHKLVLSTLPFNEAGVALYERMGFRQAGIYREQGQLDGKWVDILVMEKIL
ncbi:MAG TPA: arsinothricin resistance N-acetyltransferase ArsN1 family A [Alphaproteobacteria bacterium]|nr:arsinothricin resistance N-acetyltransferase ArsN1 family A [Alphaproteobacteria bacterium]